MRVALILALLCSLQVFAAPIVSTVAANLQTMSNFALASISSTNGAQTRIG